ncbi:MAG: hypothetical protein WBQ24_16235 [Xanthobacteraceae bacterium]
MSFLINAAVYVLYAIAACALFGAIVAQIAFFAGMKISPVTLILKPWKALPPLADNRRAFGPPGQIKKFLMFGLLLFISFLALVAGRSLDLGHPPF